MDPLTTSALITGGIGLVGGMFSGQKANKTNLKIARETNAANFRLAQYQADQNLKLWNLNNEYNTPLAQMERYQQAGLNPHLIYGNGSASAGNSGSPAASFDRPTMVAPKQDYSYIPNAIQAAMNGLMSTAAVQKTNSETAINYQNLENLQKDSAIKELLIIKQQLDNATTRTEQKYLERMLEAKISNLDSGTNLNSANTFLANARAKTERVLRPIRESELTQQVRGIILDNIGKEQENSFRVKIASARISSLLADAESSRANANLLKEKKNTEKNYGYSVAWDTKLKNLKWQLDNILVGSGLNLSSDERDRIIYRAIHHLDNNDLDYVGTMTGLRNIGSILSPFR